MASDKLSSALDGKFKMTKGYAPGEYVFRGRIINTSTCSLATATAAFDNGFAAIVAVKKTSK